jgi:hypothetical protein
MALLVSAWSELSPNLIEIKGHFTHETESPWPLHFKHSHWWKRQSWSTFASHYTRGTNIVYMDSYMASHGSCFMITWTTFKYHLLEVGLTQNRETMALRMLTTIDFSLFYHVWGPAWIEIHWNSIWLRTRSHMNSHYTWGSVTTLHHFRSVLGQPLDTFSWALTTSWSRLLAHVWIDPNWNPVPTIGVYV